MTEYMAPIKDMQFVLNELVGVDRLAELSGNEEVTPDLLEAILEEAGKYASGVLAPLNQSGDQQGAKLVDGKVVAADGFANAYQQFVDSGWSGISQSSKYGGQGLPHVLQSAVSEMWNASNLAFSLCPMLGSGAIEAIEKHATDELKETYLHKLVSGEWTGTMNLTEPQAGTDLAAIRTKAVPEGDHYLISGQKIFITWGDHEMTDNIVHLVLARLPDAPKGVKGISLFLVPKNLLNDEGGVGTRNDVRAVSLEHKMGIHASPTCVMAFGEEGGAVGYLVGKEHSGLACMFTMMNHARIGVGIQGVAIADRAYQQAVSYARDRVQGFAPGVEGPAAIVHHADVRRMLMIMRAQTEASRALAYVTSAELDYALGSQDEQLKQAHMARYDLLTPIAKAWSTEVAQEVTSLGVQVHGGMGFIEETGCAQHMRDARITTIYEGTTGIQANDLVGRKILRDGGRTLMVLISELEAFNGQLESAGASMATINNGCREGLKALVEASQWLKTKGLESPNAPGAIAVNYLMLMGTVLGGWLMARSALAAQKNLENAGSDENFCHGKLAMANFYAEHLMPRTQTYLAGVLAGDRSIMAIPAELL